VAAHDAVVSKHVRLAAGYFDICRGAVPDTGFAAYAQSAVDFDFVFFHTALLNLYLNYFTPNYLRRQMRFSGHGIFILPGSGKRRADD
jgi:hypothetical protein